MEDVRSRSCLNVNWVWSRLFAKYLSYGNGDRQRKKTGVTSCATDKNTTVLRHKFLPWLNFLKVSSISAKCEINVLTVQNISLLCQYHLWWADLKL